MVPSETLILLRPDHLPEIHEVNQSKSELCIALNLLQQALDEPSHQCALMLVNQALELLAPIEIMEPGEIFTTNTTLKAWETEDFDQFFNLKHVQARDPALCSVRSLLIAYRALLELSCSILFEAAHSEVETLKSGFRNCVSLWTRAFKLDLKEKP